VKAQQKRELFQCFQRGFKHGVGANAPDKRFLDHPRENIGLAYDRGYQRGRDVAIVEMAHEAERLRYNTLVSILRGPAPVDPPKGEAAQ
jgi:hypothetical protein